MPESQVSIVLEPTVATVVSDHIKSHQTCGVDWPDSAVYAVVYRTSTWPCGWDKENHITFFDTEDQLHAWRRRYDDWSSLEDNHVAFQAYTWDLGPVAMVGICRDGCGLYGPASVIPR
jgi:hypothetical protein